MVSHKQKRVWKYVEEGSLLKLKSYLCKHRDLDLNFSHGSSERSPLHLACCRGDDAVLRLLLKHGADVLQKDRKGDTALHTAVNRALKHGKTAYDLFEPLKKKCPQAMDTPNSAGVTPGDLLKGMKPKHREKRVWKYVEEGSLLKLKSYLCKHRDLDLNFSHGSSERSPLHLACCRGDDAVLRLLLKHGADVLQKDRKGDTALHTAVNRALKHGKTAHDDLVVPLLKTCPQAMSTPNRAGVTPLDLLKGMKHTQTASNMSRPSEKDPEKEWLEKLFGACEDEFCETFGVYDADDFLPVDDDDEDFGDWAYRIRRDYFDKKHAEAQRQAASSSGWKRRKSQREREQEEQSNKEMQERLRKSHEEYLARAARKEEETRQGKKRRYDEACAATFHADSPAGATKLSYSDIPWPAPRGTVREMVDVMLHGVDRKDVPVFRKVIRKQQTLWHPDKFSQRCETRLEEKDKKLILDTVTALSQELNRLAQSVRT